MTNQTNLRIRTMIQEAQILATEDNVLVRVAGERVCTILVDTLYELDTEADEVFSLLPEARRGHGGTRTSDLT
jgi:hypothetical protein